MDNLRRYSSVVKVKCVHVVGAGIGLSYVPSLVIIGTYFEKHRALANGMTFAAGSAGTFVVPPVIKHLLDTYGLDGTFYILGGMVFHVSVAGMLFRPPEFYVPRYLMRRKLHHMRVQAQPDDVIYLPDDVDIVAGSVMCECQPTPDIVVSADSTSQHCCEHCTIQHITYPQKPSNEDVVVPIPDITAVYVIDTSTPDGDGDLECAAVAPDVTASNCDTCSETTEEVTYNWAVLKKPLLYIYVLTLSMSDSSFGNAFMMVPTHAVDIGVSKFHAVFLVSVMGITDGVSRLLTGWLADFDKVEKKHIYKASIALCALLFFVFPLVKRYVDLVVVCALCGLVSGSFVVLAPVLLAEELGSVNIPVTYGVMYRYVMHSLFAVCLQFYRDLRFMSVCPSVRLSVCPSVRLSVCQSVRLPVCPSARLSVCMSIRLYVCSSVRLSVCPSVSLFFCPSVRLSVCPSVRLSVCPSVRLSV